MTIMGTRTQKVDDYIGRAKPFAKPILRHLRTLVHRGCPGVGETIKWGFPHFEYSGILCSMAAFTKHCAFGFWKASVMPDPAKILTKHNKTAMGHLGKIQSLKDLPSDRVLLKYLREAARLNAERVPNTRARRRAPTPRPTTPPMLAAALRTNARARKTYEALSNSHRREYIEWIQEAKREDTRQQRLRQAVAWMANGKARNWMYART
jgi:uncharacterized protein YdeI (YjbR/CyaY-like superfamily)